METKIAMKKMQAILHSKNTNLSCGNIRFQSVFNYCLDRLHYDYRNILVNSFIDCRFKFWWMEFYSKSTFYRLRGKALTSFVSLFEMIYENIQDFSY